MIVSSRMKSTKDALMKKTVVALTIFLISILVELDFTYLNCLITIVIYIINQRMLG